MRLKDLCEVNPGTAAWKLIPDEEPVPFLPMERVWTDRLDFSELRPKAEVATGYTRFAEGDVLIPKITPTFEAGRAAIATGLPSGLAAGTTELHVLRPRPGVHPRWLLYFLNHQTFLQRGHADMYGVAGQKRISDDFVKNYQVYMPPLDDQLRVADYLDAETSRLDELVVELEAMKLLAIEQSSESQTALALGDDRRRTVPAHAEPWMDALPTHWRVARLKFEARLESGHTPSRSRPELWEECSIPWVSLNDVAAMASLEYIEETANLISEAGLAASSARVLPAGTVVLSRDATIGRTAILAKPMATSQHFADWICGPNLEPQYLWLLFRSAMQAHFNSLTDGATLRTIGMPDMRQLRIPLPPRDEQRAIIQQSAEIRDTEARLRAEVDRQLALLQEHRQVLITHAVTRGIEGLPGVA